MIEQLKTIREALEQAKQNTTHGQIAWNCKEALTALTQLGAMVRVQEPVGYLHPQAKQRLENGETVAFRKTPYAGEPTLAVYIGAAPPAQQYEAGDVASASAQGFRDGVASVTQQEPVKPCCMNFAAGTNCFSDPRIDCPRLHPLAQQPQARPADVHRSCPFCNEEWVEQPQARPDFTDEWTGYLKDGETPFERFLRERKDLQSVLKLYQRVLEENERLKARQPQAEAVPVDMVLYCPKCGTQHIDMKEIRFIDRGPNSPPGNQTVWDNPPHKSHLCHGCGHIWRPSDTPTNGVEATASGKDADTAPKQAEAVPSDVVCAVAAEREACAALAQGYAGQVGDVAWAVAAAIRGRGNAAIAQQKGQS